MIDLLGKYFDTLSESYSDFLKRNKRVIIKFDKEIKNTILNKGTFIFAGNGGSFADSFHISGELTGSLLNRNRKPIKSIVLGSNPASLTAISNDFSYDLFMTRELAPYLTEKNKLIIIFTTSGKSKNIINMISSKGLSKKNTFLITGKNYHSDLNKVNILKINSSFTPHIQEIYKIFMHSILIQNNL